MNRPFYCALLWILLFMNSRYSVSGAHTSAPSSPNEYAQRALAAQTGEPSNTNPDPQNLESPARALIERWCAAYSRLDEKALAALESPNIETVDRFGELHVATQHTDEEHFWSAGFEMIRREDFHPVCDIEQTRSTRPDVAVVHAQIAYPGGIPLQGGDFIPAFSEIHTFVVLREEMIWRIAEHDITRRSLQ